MDFQASFTALENLTGLSVNHLVTIKPATSYAGVDRAEEARPDLCLFDAVRVKPDCADGSRIIQQERWATASVVLVGVRDDEMLDALAA